MNDLVSIIVPIYNVPNEMLKKCIDSLIKQTYKNIEILLVNDGTNEDNLKICNDFIKKSKLVKIINQKNLGLSGARNTGVNNATGKWITFVDGDDWIEENGIKRVISRIKDTPDIVCFGTIKEYKNTAFTYKFNNLFEDGKVYKEDCKLFLKVLFDFDSNISDATAKLYNREFLKKNQISHDINIKQGVEAFDFNFDAFLKAEEIQFLKEYIYHYSYNAESITMRPGNKGYEQIIFGLKKVEKKVIDLDNNVVTKSFYNRIKFIIVSTAISGYFNPDVKVKYKIRKKEFEKFMNNKILVKSLKYESKMDIKRKIILFFVSKKIYIPIYFLAIIRKMQKSI